MSRLLGVNPCMAHNSLAGPKGTIIYTPYGKQQKKSKDKMKHN